MKEVIEVHRSLKAFLRFSQRSKAAEPPIHGDAFNKKTLNDNNLQDLADRTASHAYLASTLTIQVSNWL
jgi:hypothetical protein